MKTSLLMLIGAMLAWPLGSEGAAYAGWAVGNAWDGYGTILHSADGEATWTNQIPVGYKGVYLQGVYTPDGITCGQQEAL